MGPYPRSTNNNRFILVIVDQLTKFVLLKPLNNSTTPKIVTYLRDDIFMTFGIPEHIHSDNGPQFISKLFQDLLLEYNIKHIRTAYYSPQSNISERVNKSILVGIRTYVNGNYKTWDRHLPKLECALRNSIHQSTKFSPFFLLFGYHMVTDGRQYELLRSLENLQDPVLTVLPLHERISAIHEEVKSYLKESFEKYARHYNLRSRVISYQPNDIVYIRQHHLSDRLNNFCGKFAPTFRQARVRKCLGRVNYECEDLDGKLIGVYHAKDLKKF